MHLCVNHHFHRTSNLSISSTASEFVDWSNITFTHLECYVDLFNATISSIFAYIILLILIYLRCSRLHSQLLNNDYLFPTHYLRGCFTSLLFLAHLCELGDSLLSHSGGHDILVPSSALIVWLGEFLLHNRIERARRPRYLIFSTILWILTLIGRCLRLYVMVSMLHNNDDIYECLRVYVTSITMGIILILIIINIHTIYFEMCTKIYLIHEPISQYISYQYSYANIFSKITFWWLTPLLWAGYREPLEINDLGLLPDEEKTSIQFHKFYNIYLQEKELINLRKQFTKKVSLWRCYIKFCWKNFLLGGLFKFFGDCMTLVGPLGISIIIVYVSQIGKKNNSLILNKFITIEEFFNNGYILGVIVFIATILQGTLSQNSTHLVNVEGIHLKTALQGMVYNKSLKLCSWNIIQENKDNDAKLKENSKSGANKDKDKLTDVGTITNLLAEDAANVMQFIMFGHYTWAIPLKIGVLIYLLHMKLGYSAVIGAFFCILTMSLLQFSIGKKLSANSKKISEQSDERINKMNETLQGIKLIKLLAWEKLHENRIQTTREIELKYLNNESIYWALMTFLTHFSSILITLVTFGVYYILEDKSLSPEDAFAGLALFNQLTVPLSIFPVAVPIIIKGVVSTRRIQEFLYLPEIKNTVPNNDHSNAELKSENDSPKHTKQMVFGLKHIEEDEESQNENIFPNQQMVESENILEITDGTYSWNMNDKMTFSIPKLTIPKGKLTIIVGRVGSGKTSLISAMLGEMYNLSGKIEWSKNVSVAYVPQKPWLINGTVRENILFGEPFRPRRFERILSVCALKQDLDLLPGRDFTEVGEKGINLSGGQKQRINIARALYSQANTIILDDPLSALDYQVGQDVFENGIQRMLLRQKRTVILATHRLQLVPNAHRVIVMEKGKIREQGTLRQLEVRDPDLTNEWSKIMNLGTNENECKSKTARDRWNLFRLVSRIGNQLKHRNSVHGTWTTSEETHVSPAPYRPLRKRPNSIYGSRHFNIAHDLPLPTDECEEEIISDERLTRRRYRTAFNNFNQSNQNARVSVVWGSNSKLHRAATRAISLQTNPVIKGRPAVIRQFSTPSIHHEPLYSSLSPQFKSKPGDFQVGKFTKFSRHGSDKAVNLEKDGDLTKKLVTSNHNNSMHYDENKVPIGRLRSSASVGSEDFDENESIITLDENGQILTNGEERTYGRIPKRVFWAYIKAGGICASFSYLISALTWQISRVYLDYWLSKWTSLEVKYNDTYNNTQIYLENTPFYSKTEYYLLIYAILSFISVLLSLASNGLGQCCGAKAREYLHDKMLKNLLRCPMSFFESTPTGRIINRFSTDMSYIDQKLAISIQRLLQFLFLCLSAIVVNTIVTPWFLIIAIPICLIYYIVQKFYRCSSRELQRLDSLTKSPILSHFWETLGGLTTIRAFGHQNRFTLSMYQKMDINSNAFLILNTSRHWLGISLDYLGGFIVLTAIITCLLTAQYYPNYIKPSLVGLAVNYTLLIPIYLHWVVRFLTDMEMYMSAVDRIENYSGIPIENYRHEGVQLRRNWPENGDIVFENVTLKYKSQIEPVICNLNLRIPAGQKIGVCGRTGSGKSSLILSLFGMVDIYDGKIKIDNVDINSIPLQKLRSKLSIIPQEVIMFGGTVRDNLDPMKCFTDEQLWSSLEMAQIKQIVIDYLGGLDGEIREGGSNLSSGQKQLLCLARVILQRSAITVMDEATSSVDSITERAFLQAAKNAFKNSTVITIAHRLEMILDCDRIIVLENGQIIEDGSPEYLQNKPDGIFSKMLHSNIA